LASSQHRLKISRRQPLRLVAAVVAAAVVGACVGVAERVRQLDANITTLGRVYELVGETGRPTARATTTAEAAPLDPFGGRAVNILITAIDTRDGDNAAYVRDTQEGLLNDVNMVAHISADRSRVDIVSIPRDTLLEIPSCPRPDGSQSYARSSAMINEAFATGSASDSAAKDEGVSCVVKTVEAATDIYLDSFILVEFAGFANVVDALGGIDICVPDGLIGRKSRIDLPPGMNHLDGRTALAYARTREGKTYSGDYLTGSDTDRISRQQQLIATVVNEVLSSGSLQSIGKINSTASAITKALFVGEEFSSVVDMAGLAYSLRDIKMENVSLFTAPWVQDTQDPNRVRLATWGNSNRFGGLNAEEVFARLAADQPVPGTSPYKVSQPDAAGSPSQPAGGAATATDADPLGPTGGAETPGGSAPTPDDDFITPLTAPVSCPAAEPDADGG
jgi:LCP family protein required for cell wall assembly